jgi:hypothetical protein
MTSAMLKIPEVRFSSLSASRSPSLLFTTSFDMPTIEELPDDTPVSVGTTESVPTDGEASSSTAPRRGGISEELAEKLARQMHAG